MIKNVKLAESNRNIATVPWIYNFKDDLIECKCLYCNKIYQKQFDENLKERFFTAYKFSNLDANKFIFLSWKGV